MSSNVNHGSYSSWGIAVALLIALPNRTMSDPLIEPWSAAYDAGDYAEAAQLLRPLAAQGNAIAQFNLAFMYAKGQGFPQDYKLAYMWADLAANSTTDKDFQKQYAGLRESLAKQMSAEQIAGAKALEKRCSANGFKEC